MNPRTPVPAGCTRPGGGCQLRVSNGKGDAKVQQLQAQISSVQQMLNAFAQTQLPAQAPASAPARPVFGKNQAAPQPAAQPSPQDVKFRLAINGIGPGAPRAREGELVKRYILRAPDSFTYTIDLLRKADSTYLIAFAMTDPRGNSVDYGAYRAVPFTRDTLRDMLVFASYFARALNAQVSVPTGTGIVGVFTPENWGNHGITLTDAEGLDPLAMPEPRREITLATSARKMSPAGAAEGTFEALLNQALPAANEERARFRADAARLGLSDVPDFFHNVSERATWLDAHPAMSAEAYALYSSVPVCDVPTTFESTTAREAFLRSITGPDGKIPFGCFLAALDATITPPADSGGSGSSGGADMSGSGGSGGADSMGGTTPPVRTTARPPEPVISVADLRPQQTVDAANRSQLMSSRTDSQPATQQPARQESAQVPTAAIVGSAVGGVVLVGAAVAVAVVAAKK